ncbi:hypothetical protein NE237_002023 [Protea cynaroides]|uniref:Uncharacterized protein n=1 Tax=Protea cynaroides TaxID=273540 RepID=A0A9Q0QYY0_9MAGN|nr:hypothetical protein NE237_002023 [Protea cynaroides]
MMDRANQKQVKKTPVKKTFVTKTHVKKTPTTTTKTVSTGVVTTKTGGNIRISIWILLLFRTVQRVLLQPSLLVKCWYNWCFYQQEFCYCLGYCVNKGAATVD